MARKKKGKVEVNASSMADIAFLLLIFFLVTTTIDTDKGIAILLPPMPEEEQDDVKLKERNVLKILVNTRDQILCNGEQINIKQLKKYTEDFIDNKNRANVDNMASSPEKAVISLKNDRGTSYEIYIAVQNELKRAYKGLRNDYGMRLYGKTYDQLLAEAEEDNADSETKMKTIRAYYRQVISEAEPEDVQISS